MPTLEFAPINLNPGITTSHEPALQVFRKCLTAINKAPGVSGMRFMKCKNDESIIVLHGIWATIEEHSDFLESGKMTPLLMDLKDFITMREVLQLGLTEITEAQKEILASSELASASFKLNPSIHDKFEGAVESVLKSKTPGDYIVAWKIKDEESFKKSENFGREGLGQKNKDDEDAEAGISGGDGPDTWAIIVRQKDAAIVEEVRAAAKGLYDTEEVLSWDNLI